MLSVKTRRVWLKGTRVLQAKYGNNSYKNELGLEGLGRSYHSAEMNMLLHSLNEGAEDDPAYEKVVHDPANA